MTRRNNAQYKMAFSPDLRSSARGGSVLEGLPMRKNNGNQRGNLLPSTGQQVLFNGVGDLQPTAAVEASYNVSASGMWSRNVPLQLPSMATAALAQPQQNIFPNPAIAAAPVTSAFGLTMFNDPRVQMFESAETNTTGQPQRLSTQSGYCFSHELLSLNRDHCIEIDAILNNYNNMLRAGINERQQKYCISVLRILQWATSKRVQEKDAELENVKRRNSELENRVSQLCSENQTLFNFASQNEKLASKLEETLQQFLITQSTAAEAAPPPPIEGYCDADGTSFPASSEHSCVKIEGATEENNEQVGRRMICKVCQEKEISILVLQCCHLCLCEECEKKVNVCPVCNSTKAGSLQIIMP